MFCSNCGEKINENAVVCVHCGCAIAPKRNTKKKNTGKGIASMVLGIISLLFSLFMSIIIFSYVAYVSSYTSSYYYSYASDRSASGAVGLLFFVAIYTILSVVGLCLSLSERKDNKNGFNTTGLCLNIIVIIIAVIHIFSCLSTMA